MTDAMSDSKNASVDVLDTNSASETKDKMMTVKISVIARSGLQGKLWSNTTYHSKFSVPSTATARDIALLLPKNLTATISSFEISNSTSDADDESVTDTSSDIFGTDNNPEADEHLLADVHGEAQLTALGLQNGETLRFYSREGEDCYGRPTC